MPLGKGQTYRANSFDLGFINITPVDVVLKVKNFDDATDELELSLVSAGVCESEAVAITRWFKESYPSKTKEKCMLRSVRAFEKLIALNYAISLPQASLKSRS